MSENTYEEIRKFAEEHFKPEDFEGFDEHLEELRHGDRNRIAELEEQIVELKLEVEDAKDSAGKAITAMTCKQCVGHDSSRYMLNSLCRSCQLAEKDKEIKQLKEILQEPNPYRAVANFKEQVKIRGKTIHIFERRLKEKDKRIKELKAALEECLHGLTDENFGWKADDVVCLREIIRKAQKDNSRNADGCDPSLEKGGEE